MANAPMIGLMRTGIGLTIGTTTDAIHARRAQRTRSRTAATKPCGTARRGMLKACTPIYRNDPGGRLSRLANPFANWHIKRDGQTVLFAQIYPNYGWVKDGGCNKIGNWMETAVKKVGNEFCGD